MSFHGDLGVHNNVECKRKRFEHDRECAMIEELIKAAQIEVDSHSIYVWGGSG